MNKVPPRPDGPRLIGVQTNPICGGGGGGPRFQTKFLVMDPRGAPAGAITAEDIEYFLPNPAWQVRDCDGQPIVRPLREKPLVYALVFRLLDQDENGTPDRGLA